MENFSTFLTICVPVRNEAKFIEDTIVQLLAQDYPKDRYEIIVADGMSDDGTLDIVRHIANIHPQVILKENPKRLSSAGRNIGFKTGRGDIFVVIDGHCYIPTNQLFKNIVACFEKSGADCLARPQLLDPPHISDFQKAVALARASRIGHGEDSLIYSDYEGFVSPVSHGAIYKREVFEKIGHVDESFDACEDVEFNYRVEKSGLKTYMSPKLTVKYYPRESLSDLFKQMVRYGKGRFQLLKKHPGTLSFNLLVPIVFVLGIAVSPIMGTLSAMSLISLVIGYGIYTIIILLASLSISVKRGSRFFRYLIPIFFSIHFGLGFGFLFRLAKRR